MPKESVYVDCCVWIAFYKDEKETEENFTDEQRNGMAHLLAEVDKGSIIIVGSTLLLAQLLSISIETLELAFDGVKGMPVAMDESIARGVRELQLKCLRSERKVLSTEDAVHLVTASIMRCRHFITMDAKRKSNQLSPLKDRDLLERLLSLQINDPSQ